MRIIKFKSPNSIDFSNYIDIGSCERDYYFINFYTPGKQEKKSGKIYFKNYNDWFENYKMESIGSKMIILHYYLSEYMGWSISENTPQIEYFKNVYGFKIFSIISSNLSDLLQFINKWFDVPTAFFKGLDLDWDEIKDRYIRTKENEDGVLTEVEFDDESVISFLDEDDTVRSFYIAEEDYLDLKNEIDYIVSRFQP